MGIDFGAGSPEESGGAGFGADGSLKRPVRRRGFGVRPIIRVEITPNGAMGCSAFFLEPGSGPFRMNCGHSPLSGSGRLAIYLEGNDCVQVL